MTHMMCHTKFIKATVAQLLSAEAKLLQICTFEALRTLVALPIRGAVGVWDGQAVPRHLPEQIFQKTEIFWIIHMYNYSG